MRDIKFNELSKAKTQDKRNIVISECSKGGFTLAEQIIVEEKNKQTPLFLKGAFHVEDTEGLINLRDAITLAISKLNETKNSEDSDTPWDNF